MSSSTFNGKVFDEVVDYCCRCTIKTIKFPETRCEFDFSGNGGKCALCTDRKLGKKRPCVAVCEAAKDKAAELVASAKQLCAVEEELANLLKKKEDILNNNKKKKAQSLINECKKRRNAAAKVHEKKGSSFKALVKKLGGIDAVAMERVSEVGEKIAKKKTAVVRPTSAPLSVDEQCLLAVRSAIKAIDVARNDLEKSGKILTAGYSTIHPESKEKVDNLFRKMVQKAKKLNAEGANLNMRLGDYQPDMFASVHYDSGDDDLSDFGDDKVEAAGDDGGDDSGDDENGDDSILVSQDGDVEMEDA